MALRYRAAAAVAKGLTMGALIHAIALFQMNAMFSAVDHHRRLCEAASIET
jgi:hypothetical protein